MGLEHLGVVVNEDAFAPQQHWCSLFHACVLQGARFDGFQHVEDRVPQRLITATGPNPLRP